MIKTIYTQYSQFPEIGSSSQPLTPGKNKKPVLLIIIGILLLLAVVSVVLGFVFLATRVWDPLWNPFRPNPEMVLSESFQKAKNVKELGYTSNFVLSLASKDKSGGKFNLEMNMNGNLGTDSGEAKINFKISSNISAKPISVSVETKNIAKKSYYNISSINIPEGLLKPEEIDLINQLKNKWIEIDESQSNGNNGQNQQIAQKIKEILTGSNIYSLKKQLKDENINGKDAYHYQLVVNNDELESVLSKTIDEALKQTGSNDFMTAVSIEYIKSFISEGLKRIGELDFDIWIGKKDLYIYKLSLEKAINIKQLDPSLGDTDAGFKMEVGYHNFDEPISVVAPKDSSKLEDVMGPIMVMAAFNEKKAIIQADMNLIRSTAASISTDTKSYLNVYCKYKSSLYDIKRLCADIKTEGGKEPVIYRSKTKYCAYVLLPSMPCLSSSVCKPPAPSYFCIDNTMNIENKINSGSIETATNPAGKGYCNGKTFVCPSK